MAQYFPLELLGNKVIVHNDEMHEFQFPIDAAQVIRERGFHGYLSDNKYFVFMRMPNGISPIMYRILKCGVAAKHDGRDAFALAEPPYHIMPRSVHVVDRYGRIMDLQYPLPGMRQTTVLPNPAQPRELDARLPPFPVAAEGKTLFAKLFRLDESGKSLICDHEEDILHVHDADELVKLVKMRRISTGRTYICAFCMGVFYTFRNAYITIASIRNILENGTELFDGRIHRFVLTPYKNAEPRRKFIRRVR